MVMEYEIAHLQEIYYQGGERYLQAYVKAELKIVSKSFQFIIVTPGGTTPIGRLLNEARWLVAAAVVSQNNHYRVKCLRQCFYAVGNSIQREPRTAMTARWLRMKAHQIYDTIERAIRGDMYAEQSLRQLHLLCLDDEDVTAAISDDVEPDYGDAIHFTPKENSVCTKRNQRNDHGLDNERAAIIEWYLDPRTKKRRKVSHHDKCKEEADIQYDVKTQFSHASSQVSEAVQSISFMLKEMPKSLKSEPVPEEM